MSNDTLHRRQHIGLPKATLSERLWMPGPKLWVGRTRWIPPGVELRPDDLRLETGEFGAEFFHVGGLRGLVVAQNDIGRFVRVYPDGHADAPLDPELHPEWDQ